MPRGERSRAAAAAAGVDGYVTRAHLRAAGISPRLAEREVAAGRWTRVAAGIYLPHPPPALPRELVRCAREYTKGPFIATGLVALDGFGLPWLPPVAGLHALVPDSVRQPSSYLITLSRTTAFADLETWSGYGARLALPARAVADAARASSSLREARGIVLGAVAKGCATPEELRSIVDTGQRNGSASVRRAVLDAERGCASPPEAELVDQLVGRHEPFLVNPEVWVGRVLLGRPDIWLVRRHVGGEVESREFHEGDQLTESTYDRHERFGVAGVPLVHLSVRKVREQPPIAGAWLLARAAALQVEAPSGLRVVPRGPLLR